VVLSTFVAFTVDDQPRCAGELVRVTRPGGVIVTTAWSGDGMFATRNEVVADCHPALFERGGPDPRAWEDPDGLAAIYAGLDVEFTAKWRTRWLGYASGEAAMETFEVASGPVRRLRHAVEQAGGSWAEVRTEILARWRSWLAGPVGSMTAPRRTSGSSSPQPMVWRRRRAGERVPASSAGEIIRFDPRERVG
jgi:hypothetical protein